MVQLRDKLSPEGLVIREAEELARLFKASRTLFIVNDYLSAAKVPFCDGVHLGQSDMPLEQARKTLGKKKIIGISCHSFEQAVMAQRGGADYIGIGPIEPTPTKPGCKAVGLNLLRQLKGEIEIPYFAIGNVRRGNIAKILSTGARRIAVCRAALADARIKSACRRLKKLLS